MNTVKIDNKTFVFPSTWNELDRDQLLRVATVFMMEIPDIEKKIRIIIHFLKLKGRIISHNERNYLLFGKYKYFKWMIPGGIRTGKVKQIVDEDLFMICETLNFLFEKNMLTIQLVPVISKKFYGPDSRLANVSFIEFAKADIRHRNYISSENEMYLDEMLAVLYRPAKKFISFRKFLGLPIGDIRQKYSDDCIKNAKHFKNIPRRYKKALLLYWEGCYNFMIDTFPHVFTGNSDGSDDGFGFAGMITELAGSKFGNTEQTAETNMLTILLHLEIISTQQKKSKQPEV
jgi:hypothetical protein